MSEPYYQDEHVTLYAADCLAELPALPDASVDAVVTDPPYGLEFMGSEWDGADGFRRSLNPADAGRADVFGRTSKTSPEYRTGARGAVIKDPATERGGFQDGNGGNPYSRSRIEYGRGGDSSHLFQEWCEAWATECLRVLKPGGHMLAFGGTRTSHRLACAIEDAGFEIRDSIAWLHGQGFPKGKAQLKPAHEPIVVARRPGKSTLNIDACRIEGVVPSVPNPIFEGSNNNLAVGGRNGTMSEPHPDGRWPTNVVVDESQAEVLDSQSGNRPGASSNSDGQEKTRDVFGKGWTGVGKRPGYADQGGASRFFYVAKADSAERPRINGIAHPTVKPLSLMRWLVRLVTPPGGLVLDPFAGSGTTVEACVLEGLRCVAIEREADYLPLITSRLRQGVLDFGSAS